MTIDPIYWLTIAAERQPKSKSVTDWISGGVAPVRVGIYERHFTDGNLEQYWDGKVWRCLHGNGSAGPAHWRQVGDYPAWRGLKEQP